jgi:hypothetical protein
LTNAREAGESFVLPGSALLWRLAIYTKPTTDRPGIISLNGLRGWLAQDVIGFSTKTS